MSPGTHPSPDVAVAATVTKLSIASTCPCDCHTGRSMCGPFSCCAAAGWTVPPSIAPFVAENAKLRVRFGLAAVADATVTLKWRCACAVGAPYWQTIDIYECDECGHEFETEENREDYLAGLCSTSCPKCTQELSQRTDDPELKA